MKDIPIAFEHNVDFSHIEREVQRGGDTLRIEAATVAEFERVSDLARRRPQLKVVFIEGFLEKRYTEHFARGQAVERENPAEAIDAYRRALEYAPDDRAAINNMSNNCLRLGLARTACMYAERVVRGYPENRLGYFNLGLAQLMQAEYREAVTTLSNGLRHFPNDAQFLYFRGRGYLALRQKEAGIRDMQQSAAGRALDAENQKVAQLVLASANAGEEIGPPFGCSSNEELAQYKRVMHLASKGRLPEALEAATQLCSSLPTSYEPYLTLATLACGLDKWVLAFYAAREGLLFSESLAEARRGLDRSGVPTGYFALARVYESQGYSDCQKDLESEGRQLATSVGLEQAEVDRMASLASGRRRESTTGAPARSRGTTTLRGAAKSMTASGEIFISYKSEDVAVARQIAEALTAGGLPVWFGEYQILLDERHRFEEVLDQGLRRCAKAIALTNDRYTRSPYCDKEIRTLLDTVGPENIVEVMIPREPEPHLVHPRLEGAHSVVWQGSVYALFDELREVGFCSPAGPLLSRGDLTEPVGKRLHIAVPKVSFGTAAWISLATSPWSQGQTIYTRHVGSSQLRVHVLVNLIGQTRRSRQDHGILDDRQVFNQNLEAARLYRNEIAVAYLHQRLLGVHLLFALGYSHFAMTYQLSPILIHVPKRIHRKYVLTFSDRESSGDVEIVITGSVGGARHLSDFLSYAPLFDRFVNSIAWD